MIALHVLLYPSSPSTRWPSGKPLSATPQQACDDAAISPAGVLRSHAPRALFVAHDVVEAAVRTGRRRQAVAHVAALREAHVECRRRMETALAREHLREAATIFRGFGAAPWARRADAEIRATGETRTVPDRSRSTLTAQELQIARLAATGMRNKKIGAELFLSPRTASAHLCRIFPKLGITSRAALRDRLSSLMVPADG